jgi:hypothetical protein
MSHSLLLQMPDVCRDARWDRSVIPISVRQTNVTCAYLWGLSLEGSRAETMAQMRDVLGWTTVSSYVPWKASECPDDIAQLNMRQTLGFRCDSGQSNAVQDYELGEFNMTLSKGTKMRSPASTLTFAPREGSHLLPPGSRDFESTRAGFSPYNISCLIPSLTSVSLSSELPQICANQMLRQTPIEIPDPPSHTSHGGSPPLAHRLNISWIYRVFIPSPKIPRNSVTGRHTLCHE